MGGGGGGGGGGGPVESDTLSLWMDLFSLDFHSNLQLFASFTFEVDFSETYLVTSAEIAFWSLQI